MDTDLAAIADPTLDQHFLVSDIKLRELVQAAGIRSTDHVLELGAGAGTVARALPPSATLTVVEFDSRLTGILQKNVPHAKVIQGDGLTLMRELSYDVLIGNLPHWVTEQLIVALPDLKFRVAVLAVGASTDLEPLRSSFRIDEVCSVTGDDFLPPQGEISRIVRIEPIRMCF
jgi:16S rRNA A1518/A1519 N6-dimethyltransferase RsmA/KsgA/DIM1 with predicted DNA glycosylase/AP lyase activity